MLRIDLTAYSAPSGKGSTAFALYRTFVVGNASSDYTLVLDGYSGKIYCFESYRDTSMYDCYIK